MAPKFFPIRPVIAASAIFFILAGCDSSPGPKNQNNPAGIPGVQASVVESITNNFLAPERTDKGSAFNLKYETAGKIPAVKFSQPAVTDPPGSADGLIPQFNYLAKGWLPVMQFRMDRIWQAFGFPETGVNYYSCGAPNNATNQHWERFDPAGPLYEDWFGTYVIDNFEYASEWYKPGLESGNITNSVRRVLDLTIADQIAWLAAYGGPAAASVIPGSVKVVKGINGWFYIFALLNSYSDMGAAAPSYPWVWPYPFYETLVAPYQPVTIEGVLMIRYDAISRQMLAIYGTGTSYELLDGSVKNTPPSTILEIAEMMSSVSYR